MVQQGFAIGGWGIQYFRNLLSPRGGDQDWMISEFAISCPISGLQFYALARRKELIRASGRLAEDLDELLVVLVDVVVGPDRRHGRHPLTRPPRGVERNYLALQYEVP